MHILICSIENNSRMQILILPDENENKNRLDRITTKTQECLDTVIGKGHGFAAYYRDGTVELIYSCSTTDMSAAEVGEKLYEVLKKEFNISREEICINKHLTRIKPTDYGTIDTLKEGGSHPGKMESEFSFSLCCCIFFNKQATDENQELIASTQKMLTSSRS